MSASETWWLGHASSLTIRAFGMDLVNRSKTLQEHCGILHIGAMALGWAMDEIFSIIYPAV